MKICDKHIELAYFQCPMQNSDHPLAKQQQTLLINQEIDQVYQQTSSIKKNKINNKISIVSHDINTAFALLNELDIECGKRVMRNHNYQI